MQQLQQRGCIGAPDEFYEIFPDLDRGIEWCENQIVESTTWRRSRFMPLALQLSNLFFEGDLMSSLMNYLEQFDIAQGDLLFKKGDVADAIFFLEFGQLTVFNAVGGDRTRRIKTLRPGSLVGEMGFYSRQPRIASVIADHPSRLYRLTHTSFQQML
jgi:SulP family sulfate permease